MIIWGKLNHQCGEQCELKHETYEIECPDCGGYGCDKCRHGQLAITGCPQEICRGIAPTIDLIELFNKGIMPIAGGVLDQSASFVEAARFYRQVEARVKPRWPNQ